MSLISLQKKIGTSPDGVFGKETLQLAAKYYKLTPVRAAHFFAQTGHETGEFKIFSENLNYSAEGLVKNFHKYFPTIASATSFAHNPTKIANKVYGNRMGNGNDTSGDGWKYRGRGALQTTGHDNYLALSKALNRPDIMTNPDIVSSELSFESAMFFFNSNKLWSICDHGVDDITISILRTRVNGGSIGLEDCKVKTKKYYSLLI
jgi:putative chitinase